jgi:hypothetical protein
VVTDATLTYADGTTAVERSETWQRTTAPFDERTVTMRDGRAGREMATVNGYPEVYNPLTNTIGKLRPDIQLPPPRHPATDSTFDRIRDGIVAMLGTGDAHEAGRVVVDGRDAFKIEADDGSAIVVDADTYDPIEVTLPFTGPDGTMVVRVVSREALPVTDANLKLLSVEAQHPDAAIDATGTVEGAG